MREHSNRRNEPACVIDWRRDFPEPLATTALEVTQEIHRIATERLAPARTNSGQDQPSNLQQKGARVL